MSSDYEASIATGEQGLPARRPVLQARRPSRPHGGLSSGLAGPHVLTEACPPGSPALQHRHSRSTPSLHNPGKCSKRKLCLIPEKSPVLTFPVWSPRGAAAVPWASPCTDARRPVCSSQAERRAPQGAAPAPTEPRSQLRKGEPVHRARRPTPHFTGCSDAAHGDVSQDDVSPVRSCCDRSEGPWTRHCPSPTGPVNTGSRPPVPSRSRNTSARTRLQTTLRVRA